MNWLIYNHQFISFFSKTQFYRSYQLIKTDYQRAKVQKNINTYKKNAEKMARSA